MYQMAAIAAIGFISAFSGAWIGFFIAYTSKRMGKKFEGCVSGFTAGLLIAFVCFKILEEGFEAAPLYLGIFGILLGVLAAAWLEGFLADVNKQDSRASYIIGSGVMLHHFPEGVALGGMLAAGAAEGLMLALIICLHCAPEAAAVLLPLRSKKPSLPLLAAYATALSLPMMAGSVIGALLTEISGSFQALALTFAGGVMLYITCGEMLPGSKELWRGRLTTICALLGFILGVVITA